MKLLHTAQSSILHSLHSLILESDNSVAQTPYQFEVNFERFEQFENALAKINKNALKYGIKPLKIVEKTKVKSGKKIMWLVKLDGDPVKIKDWEFVASLEHGEKGNVIRFAPGLEETRVKDYAQASNRHCDFCNTARDRNHTYVIRNIETDELKQVGGQCLKRFISDEANKLAKFYFSIDELLRDMLDDGLAGGKGMGVPATDVMTALSYAILVKDRYGYVPVNDFNKDSTSSIVRALLFFNDSKFAEDYIDALKLSAIDWAPYEKRAEEMIKWFNDIPDNEKTSSYMISMQSIIDSDMVSNRSIGLIASLPIAYDKANNLQKQRAATKPSEWVGTPSTKIPATDVTVIFAREMDGNYGPYQMVKFKDDNDNIYTWFNTSSSRLDLDARYNIVGKVKKHDEYQNVKSTVLTHVKAKKL